MAAARRRKVLGIVVALGLGAGAGVAAPIVLAGAGADGPQQPDGTEPTHGRARCPNR